MKNTKLTILISTTFIFFCLIFNALYFYKIDENSVQKDTISNETPKAVTSVDKPYFTIFKIVTGRTPFNS